MIENSKSSLLVQLPTIEMEWNADSRLIIWKPEGVITAGDWEASFNVGVDFWLKKYHAGIMASWVNDCRYAEGMDFKLLFQWNDYFRGFEQTNYPMKIAFIRSYTPLYNAAIDVYDSIVSTRPNNRFIIQKFSPEDTAEAYLWASEETL